LFGTRLAAAGHPIGVISNFGHQGAPINWLNLQVFGNSFHPYCMDIMHMHSEIFKADAMVTMLDLQVMEVEALQGTKWIAWFPVDHVTIPQFIFEKVKQANFRITMSQHASREMDKTGLDYYYVPCGVDTKIYKPLPMQESREVQQLPKDKFIVGMVAMNKGNPSRKAFHQNIMAFAALQKKHKDCVLYLHTTDGTRGADMVNLVEYCKALGLKHGYAYHESAKEADVIFADQYGLTMGYDPAMMAQLYSSMDVHLLVTCGEGFGIPIIEAQACGTPVIVGSWTSMPELCFSGWKVPVEGTEPYFTPLMAFQMWPRTSAIAEQLDNAYRMRGNQDYRKRAKEGAQAYDADRIVEKYWLPVLTDIESKLQSIPVGSLARNLDILRVA